MISDDTAAIEAALEVLAAQKPLLYAANKDNYEKMTEIAKANSCPLVVKGEDLNSLAELVEKIVALGHNDLVLDPGSRDTGKVLVDMTQIRRQAVKNKFRPFGFPTITFTSKDDPQEELLQAGTYLAKYASIVVMKT